MKSFSCSGGARLGQQSGGILREPSLPIVGLEEMVPSGGTDRLDKC